MWYLRYLSIDYKHNLSAIDKIVLEAVAHFKTATYAAGMVLLTQTTNDWLRMCWSYHGGGLSCDSTGDLGRGRGTWLYSNMIT
jgi:hypothetical protein